MARTATLGRVPYALQGAALTTAGGEIIGGFIVGHPESATSEQLAGKPVIAARGHDPTSPTTVEAVHVTPEDPRSAKALTVDGMFNDDPPPPPPPPPPGNAPFAKRRIWTGLLTPP